MAETGKFNAELANYLGWGDAQISQTDGSWHMGLMNLKLGRHRVRLIQDKKVVQNKVRKGVLTKTTDVEIHGIANFNQGRSIIDDLSRVLSLASYSQVVPLSYSYNGTKNTPSIVHAEAMNFRPLLSIKRGEAVHNYLEQVWIPFRKLKAKRKLAEVIDMLTIAELPVQPLEVRLAQIFIILENLKGTFAKANNIPFERGFFRDVVDATKPLHKQPTLGFENLMMRMFDDVGMKPNLRRTVKLRNEIIHFGLSRKSYASLRGSYDYSQDIVREYLLRLMNFTGDYLIYSTAARSVGRIE